MKNGRDWTIWKILIVIDQDYIARHLKKPFPCFKKDFKTDEEITGPIFKLDVWGVKEPK